MAEIVRKINTVRTDTFFNYLFFLLWLPLLHFLYSLFQCQLLFGFSMLGGVRVHRIQIIVTLFIIRLFKIDFVKNLITLLIVFYP